MLNKKEQREITKLWRVPADAARTTLTVKEQESGQLLKTERAEKVFSAAPPRRYSKALSSLHARPCDSATPGYVMCPAYVFTPSRIAALSWQACSSPLAHNSAR